MVCMDGTEGGLLAVINFNCSVASFAKTSGCCLLMAGALAKGPKLLTLVSQPFSPHPVVPLLAFYSAGLCSL